MYNKTQFVSKVSLNKNIPRLIFNLLESRVLAKYKWGTKVETIYFALPSGS